MHSWTERPHPCATGPNRAGLKLEAALEHFGVDVAGLRCLDAGLSTGGFADCLLQRRAAHVVGVDVGYGQARACACAAVSSSSHACMQLPEGCMMSPGLHDELSVRQHDERHPACVLRMSWGCWCMELCRLCCSLWGRPARVIMLCVWALPE